MYDLDFTRIAPASSNNILQPGLVGWARKNKLKGSLDVTDPDTIHRLDVT